MPYGYPMKCDGEFEWWVRDMASCYKGVSPVSRHCFSEPQEQLLATTLFNASMHFCRLIQLYSCWLLLVSARSIDQLFYWQQRLFSQEPLLRFPFINYLANPCGSTSNSGDISAILMMSGPAMDRNELQEMRTLSAEIPVADQSFSFLSNFRDRYTSNNNYTRKELGGLAQEFRLVLNEAKVLVRRIYSPTAFLHCQGIQLQSLPDMTSLLSLGAGAQLREIYRGLMITAGHLHLILRDVVDSGRMCPFEARDQHQHIHLLSGKIETLMCLILHSGRSDENYFEIAYQVLQTVVYRYYDCSARETRGCLVIRYADRILSAIHTLVEDAGTQHRFGPVRQNQIQPRATNP